MAQTQVQQVRPKPVYITCAAYYNEVPEGQACPCGCGIVQPRGHRDPRPTL